MKDKKLLLDRALAFLKVSSIGYVFLREKLTVDKIILSTQSSSDDIDIYIEASRVSEFIDYLTSENFIHMLPRKLFIHIESELKIDIHFGTYVRLPFPQPDFFLKNIKEVNGLSFLDTRFQFLILLLHPLDLSGIRGHRAYTEDKLKFLNLHKMLIFDPLVKSLICSWLGKFFYTKIQALLIKDPKLILAHYWHLKLFALFQSKTLYKHTLKRLFSKASSFYKQRGLLISIMGVDGSGKTTLSNNLNIFFRSYSPQQSSDIIYMGMLGPYILPINQLSNIYRFLFNKKASAEDSVDFNFIDNMSAIRRLKQKLVITLVGIDLILRNLLVIWRVYFLKQILITDRSIFDQHTKFNFNLILRTVRLVSIKPSHFIFLEGDTAEIYKRKKEYSPAELKKHQNLHLSYLKHNYLERLVILDAAQIEKTVFMQSLKRITQAHNESY